MATVLKWNQRIRQPIHIEGESRTLQAHKDSSDVNLIVARYQRTGELPPNPRGIEPQYGDVTHLQGDLTENYNYANELAEEATAQLEEDRRKAREAAEERSHSENNPSPDQPKDRAARADEPTQGSEAR